MSTTTEKPSLLDTLKAQAAEITAKIKAETDKHLETLHAKLKEAHELVSNLTKEIESHTGRPAPAAPAKRGRKKGYRMMSTKLAKAPKKAKVKRGKLGQSINDFLVGKGKSGAHVKEIAAHVGKPAANVTAWIYSTGKSKVKKVAPATFALKK